MSYAYLASTPGLKFNYSLYAIPAGWVVSMAPLWWAIGRTNTESPGAYNNAMPKDSWESLKGKIDEQTYRRVHRAVSAQNNCHTNLPLFAASLAIANAAHVSSDTLHLCAGAWLATRVAYNLVYIFIEDPTYSYIRSLLYLSGVGSCLTLVWKAADKYRSIPW